jgi:subtilisin family serine protease
MMKNPHAWPRPLLLSWLLRMTAVAVGFGMIVAPAEGQRYERRAPQQDEIRLPPETAQARFFRLVDQAEAEGRVSVIVRLNMPDFQSDASLSATQQRRQRRAIRQGQSDVLDRLPAGAVDLQARFEFIPYMALSVDSATLLALNSMPEVVGIEENELSAPDLASSIPIIGADNAWADGFDGTGWFVAVLDTGVDKTHPYFSTGGNKVKSEACYSGANFYGSQTVCPGGVFQATGAGSAAPCSIADGNCDHGTHVAGIAAGNDGSGPNYGVARGAKVIAIQVFSDISGQTLSYSSDQIRGLERVYALRNTYQIAAVNMSLGGGQYFDPCDDDQASRKEAIDNLKAAGIATVIATGNNGYTTSMGAPACISSAVSVGSSTDADQVSSFSNSAYFQDLLAPGSAITSAVPGGGTGNWSGTSMATPHVAGAWAVLQQAAATADPALRGDGATASVNTILNALKNTGTLIDDVVVQDLPRINVDDAVDTLAPAVPAAPTNFAAAVVSGTEIDLSWTDNASNETGFDLWRRQKDGGVWSSYTKETLAANSTAESVTGLTAGKKYQFKLRATNGSGDSSWVVAIKTTPAPPAAPTNLAAVSPNGTKINLTWTDNANNETGFDLWRRQKNGAVWSGWTTQTLAANKTSQTVTGLTAGKKYQFKLRATNASGTSSWLSVIQTTVSPPAAPTNLAAAVVSGTKIDLTWTDNANNETGFDLWRRQKNGGVWSGYTKQTLAADKTSKRVTGLTVGKKYQFFLRATNAAGDSAWINVIETVIVGPV